MPVLDEFVVNLIFFFKNRHNKSVQPFFNGVSMLCVCVFLLSIKKCKIVGEKKEKKITNKHKNYKLKSNKKPEEYHLIYPQKEISGLIVYFLINNASVHPNSHVHIILKINLTWKWMLSKLSDIIIVYIHN